MSPMELFPESSWLLNVREESRERSDWSDVRMERDDVDDADGEKESGEKP